MKTKVNWMLIACSILLVYAISCNETAKQNPYQRLDDASWLLGHWFHSNKDGDATEIWKKANDSTFTAESIIVSGTDTVFFENVTLAQRNQNIDYIVSEANQQPVNFTLINADNSTLVFENQQHDFPTQISYKKINNDSLYAEISGIINGSQKKESFPFKKIIGAP